MSKATRSIQDKDNEHRPAVPGAGHEPKLRDESHTQRGSTGQQQAQQRADLAQHGVQIHERSRNVDRASSGKK